MASVWKKVIQYFVPPVDKNERPQHECHDPPPVLRAELQIPQAIVERYETHQHTNAVQERERARVDYVRLIVEFSTLAFVILSAWMLYRTLEATRIAATATKGAADAAVDSVAVARDTLNATIENNRLDQRAWVGVIRPLTPTLKVGEKTIFGVTLVNSGKTPARRVAPYVVARRVPKGQTLETWYPAEHARKSITILSPGIPMSIYDPDITRIFSESDVENIKNKNVTVYLFGKVFYEDVSSQPHCLTFCYFLSPDLKLGHACAEYNEETDTQCDT